MQKKKKEDKLKFKHTSGLYLGKIVSEADIVPHIRLKSTLYQNNFNYNPSNIFAFTRLV